MRLNSFTGRLHAEADVDGTCEDVYAVVSRPEFISRSTPFVRDVVDIGDDRWRWDIAGIRYPGGTFTAALTEKVTFEPPHRIAFRHDPDGTELAGTEGAFTLTPARDRTGGSERVHLAIEVDVTARVPAPRRAAPVVEAAMHVVMGLMRDRFVRAVTAELAEAAR
ncbi:hypothetical protein G7072_06290 [Nocardioides sp. HDW12B]|uniref:SRPBCC family protein n=1 Tax=Nocardioides sp. HDW12B TaxID=2714939 RepID=UPI0014084633|nr:SRPBCC family protein [Nocardioides sp. HDW12B]QIK66000.1 hypothetical protein G7072_06290 [Nocardioides sp. HDW12B]